jgi:hypothetical protein
LGLHGFFTGFGNNPSRFLSTMRKHILLYLSKYNFNCYKFLVLLSLDVLGSLGYGGFDDDDAEAGALGVERSDSEVIHG